jgi:hypothetical protein
VSIPARPYNIHSGLVHGEILAPWQRFERSSSGTYWPVVKEPTLQGPSLLPLEPSTLQLRG